MTVTETPDLTTPEDSGNTRDRIDELLDGDSTPVESPDETPVEEEVPAEPTVEGPSVAMQTVARQAGVPQGLVDTARDDAQLKSWIELASPQEDSRVPEPEPEPEFQLTLSEDEYGSDDAVRQQFEKMREHYSGQIASIKEDFTQLVDVLKNVSQDQRTQAEQQAATVQAEFDRALDDLNEPMFGKYGQLDDTTGGIRAVIYKKKEEIRKDHRGVSEYDLAKIAAETVVPILKDKFKAAKQRNAIQNQGRMKLGAGNSKPAPDPDLSPAESFAQKMAERFGVLAE